MDAVYLDYKPVETTPGIAQTLNIVIPASVTSSVADQGTSDPTITDVAETTKAIAYNHNYGYGYLIRDFEQFNSPESIRTVFLDAAIKGVGESINGVLTALVTTGNFTTNTAISSTHYPSVTDFTTSYGNLATNKVPMSDTQNLTMLNHPLVHAKILGDSNWTNQSIAGELVADRIRATGDLRVMMGSQVKYDQQMPVTGTVGSRTFTGIHMHRWAVALATRPLPKPDQKVVDYTYIFWKGVPIRLTVGYNQLKGGYVVLLNAGFGCAVIRESLGQLFTIAE